MRSFGNRLLCWLADLRRKFDFTWMYDPQYIDRFFTVLVGFGVAVLVIAGIVWWVWG